MDGRYTLSGFRFKENTSVCQKIITFKKISEPYGWLGNMSRHPLVVDGVEYPTPEHYFQCLRFEDKNIIQNICKQKSPMSAKMIAKTFFDKLVVIPRSNEDLFNMSKTISLKVNQHPYLKLLLEELKECFIIEDVTKRPNASGKFWGMANISGEWIGYNHLGNIWMQEIKKIFS